MMMKTMLIHEMMLRVWDPTTAPLAQLLLLPNQCFGVFLSWEEGASFCHLSFGEGYIFLKISIKIPYMTAAALIKWQCCDLTAAPPNHKPWWLCHNLLLLQQLPLSLLQLLGERGNIASDSPWVLAVCQTRHSVMYRCYFISSSRSPCEVSTDTSYLKGSMGIEANLSHSESELTQYGSSSSEHPRMKYLRKQNCCTIRNRTTTNFLKQQTWPGDSISSVLCQ